MSKSDVFEAALLDLILNNAAFAGVGDAGGILGSSVDGSLYISLHTGDPGESGTQATSEATYTGYTRVAVARDGNEWTIVGNQASNVNKISFPQATGGTESLTYFGVGVDPTGAGNLLYSNALFGALNVTSGIKPEFAVGSLTISEN